MELTDVNTDVDLDALRSNIDDLRTELKEWGVVCEGVVDALDDVGGALDAEDFKGAVEDALSRIRLLDWSGPMRMEFLLPGKLHEIENQFDELVADIARAEPEPAFSVGVNGDPPILLRRFDSHNEAAGFLNQLEGVQDGRYYLDGPET